MSATARMTVEEFLAQPESRERGIVEPSAGEVAIDLAEDDQLTSPQLPGFAMPVSALLA